MKGNFIIATTARPSRQGAGCDHFIGASKGPLKENSPCLLLLGEGAAAAADVEGTPKMLDRARFELSGVPSTPLPGFARSTLGRHRGLCPPPEVAFPHGEGGTGKARDG